MVRGAGIRAVGQPDRRRLKTGAQDTILPHKIVGTQKNPAGGFGPAGPRRSSLTLYW